MTKAWDGIIIRDEDIIHSSYGSIKIPDGCGVFDVVSSEGYAGKITIEPIDEVSRLLVRIDLAKPDTESVAKPMNICAVCGRDGEHIECRNPLVYISLNATALVSMIYSVDHYYKILDTIDPGGAHVIDSVRWGVEREEINGAIREAMAKLKGGGKNDRSEQAN